MSSVPYVHRETLQKRRRIFLENSLKCLGNLDLFKLGTMVCFLLRCYVFFLSLGSQCKSEFGEVILHVAVVSYLFSLEFLIRKTTILQW